MPVNLRVADLTLAQRHVVEIARALATKPKVLFLDEPTEPFQQADIRKLFDLIKSLRQQGMAIVYVSHRLHEVTELADRITVIRDGEMVDTRAARDFTMADIITRIAGRPLAQMFPSKASKPGAALLEVRDLSGGGFDEVGLTVRAGEIVGLAGVEGEGQREFLRAVAGVDRRTKGEVRVAGKPVHGGNPSVAREAGMGFVTDDRHAEGLFLNLSVRENLGLGFLGKIARGGVIDRAKEIQTGSRVAEQLRVRAASLEAPVSSLSGGNQQKVLFGREIAAEPKVLLVDEPTSGVDVGARTEIYQRLRALADQGLAVLVASSDGVELEGLCDRVFIFARGKIVRELTGAEVTDEIITEANLTATASRTAVVGQQRRSGLHKLLASDHFPALVLTVITAVIMIGTQAANEFFLTGFNITQMLTLLSVLCFVSMGQLLTILVGGIDLSLGPLVGFCVVLASYVVSDGDSTASLVGGSVLILLFCTAFGLLQGVFVALLRLPSVVVTLASFMGLQGLSLLLRPHPKGEIDDMLSDVRAFPCRRAATGHHPGAAGHRRARMAALSFGYRPAHPRRRFEPGGQFPSGCKEYADHLACLHGGGCLGWGRGPDAGGADRHRLGHHRGRFHAAQHHRRRARRRQRRRRARVDPVHPVRQRAGAGDHQRLLVPQSGRVGPAFGGRRGNPGRCRPVQPGAPPSFRLGGGPLRGSPRPNSISEK